MSVIVCHNPSTFFSSDKNIKVLDDKKNLFYFHPNNEGKINFNLPKGVYLTNNNIERRSVFVPYPAKFKSLPKDIFEGFKVYECKNKHIATIFPDEKRIFIDTRIINHEFKPLVTFVLGHEMSHCLPEGRVIKCYNDQFNWCDANSAGYMLCNGYNPMQIQLAHKLLIGDGYRNECIKHLTTQPNYRR